VPGGWVELQDFNTHAYSEDESAGSDNNVLRFCEIFNKACEKMGREGSPGQHLKGWVEAAGFINVQHRVYKVPIGPWAKDKKLVRTIPAAPLPGCQHEYRNISEPYSRSI